MLVDLPDYNFVFPPEIYATAERPAIVIWSVKSKRVILIELTCPAEEGMEAAQVRKQARYLSLMNNIAINSSWKPLLLTLEVGVRGFIATSTQQVFQKLGLPRDDVSTLPKNYQLQLPSVHIQSSWQPIQKVGIIVQHFWICKYPWHAFFSQTVDIFYVPFVTPCFHFFFFCSTLYFYCVCIFLNFRTVCKM